MSDKQTKSVRMLFASLAVVGSILYQNTGSETNAYYLNDILLFIGLGGIAYALFRENLYHPLAMGTMGVLLLIFVMNMVIRHQKNDDLDDEELSGVRQRYSYIHGALWIMLGVVLTFNSGLITRATVVLSLMLFSFGLYAVEQALDMTQVVVLLLVPWMFIVQEFKN